jgi:hypothetical protein
MFNAAVFLDPQRCASRARAWITDLYRSLIARSVLLKGCLNGTMVGGLMARDASSSIATPLVGEDFLRVGQAAFTIDPLSSQGVQAAMLTALQAAAVINTTLRRPDSVVNAVAFYRDRQGRRAEQFHRLSTQFYAARARHGSRQFWRERAAGAAQQQPEMRGGPFLAGARLRLATDARLLPQPVIYDNLVVLEQALVHPRLEEPCAFVNGLRLAPLLAQLGDGQTADEILLAWSKHFPPPVIEKALHWLCGIGALSPAGEAKDNA